MSDAPTAIRRWIAGDLRALRMTRGLKRRQVADHLGKSEAAIGHFETGFSLASAAELDKLLDFYGVPERKEFFRELRRAAKSGRDWWLYLGDVVPDWFNLYLGVERAAQRIESYDALWVPGLLQTEDYGRALIKEINPGIDADRLDRQMELRAGRQSILERSTPQVSVHTVIDESALRRRVGGPSVLARQLDHLLALRDHPHITVQVLPATHGGHPGADGTCTLLTFPPELEHDPGLVYIETAVRGIYVEDHDELQIYRERLERLRTIAADPAHSTELIANARKELTAA
ncbi:helix-turn-helix domain-containing protein [Saccharothrix lopnurensis]|uniref:Helix-turn-helix transcriptional regulator n=1 Tax=Saccharothrix lopnurensis TaxID=1670621 RepID=A0ABW1PEZ7_9PSEU